MKFIVINGGPRKKWNTAQMLESCMSGIRSVDATAEIERIDIFDLNYKGCRSCFGCKLKTREGRQCVVQDDLYDVLRSIRCCDGFVIASPIYYFDVTAALRALLERLYYPGESDRTIPVGCIYTMNQPQEVMEERFRHELDSIKFFMELTFHNTPEEACSFQTLHWDHPEKYRFAETLYDERKRRHDEQFPIDLQNAHELGKRLAEKAKEASV